MNKDREAKPSAHTSKGEHQSNAYVWGNPLTTAILAASSTEVALVDANLVIAEAGPRLEKLLDMPRTAVLNSHLHEVLPELIGYDELLTDIAARRVPDLHLPMVNRLDGNGRLRYLDLTLQACPDLTLSCWLLLLVTDVTEQARLKQQVTQQRNELHLLSHKLFQLNNRLDKVLRHYLPADVVDAILSGQMSQEPGGELREVTVLFADMRGYTKVARTLPPKEVMSFLNHHLHVASEAIAEFEGTIAQYMGDAIMAVFNAIVDQPDHAWRAVQAGFRIHEAISTNYSVTANNWGSAIGFGVGIFTGPALVGNTGAQWQYAFSAIGNTTNMAYRLTMLAGHGEVYIGEETYQAVKNRVKSNPMAPLDVKGIEKPVPTYRVEVLF